MPNYVPMLVSNCIANADISKTSVGQTGDVPLLGRWDAQTRQARLPIREALDAYSWPSDVKYPARQPKRGRCGAMTAPAYD